MLNTNGHVPAEPQQCCAKYQESDPLFANILERICYGIGGATIMLLIMLLTGIGQDVPGTGGLTRYQLAKMLYDCDRGKYEGYCVVDVNIRPNEVRE